MAVIETEAVPVSGPATGGTVVSVSGVQWGPVILGALGAAAISMVLLAFGAGIGLSAVSAQPYAGASAKALAVISAIYLIITTVASFAIGGYIAGRLRAPREAVIDERHFRDGAHGFGVWAVGILLGASIAAGGISTAGKAVGQATAAIVAGGTAGAASNPALGQALSATPTDYAVDRLLAPSSAPAAGGDNSQAPANQASATPQSRADLAAPLGRAFATALHTGQLDPRDRTMLVQIVMRQTGLSQADAEKRVDDAYAELKTAEQKARDTAEKARKVTLIAAFATAATLLLACAAAAGGAAAGGKHRDEQTVIRVFGTSRFW